MIRIATQPAPDPIPDWHAGFLALLPAIVRQACRAFWHLRPEARQDAIVEVVANACVAYVRLFELGKADVAYSTPLALYAIKQCREGRRVGNHRSVRDVLSEYSQRNKGFAVERLDRFDPEENEWREAIVEDHRAGPAETAAARIDIGNWFNRLLPRDQSVANALAIGGRTGDVARAFSLSPARIAQKRREYEESWHEFQGESNALEAPGRPGHGQGPGASIAPCPSFGPLSCSKDLER